MEARSRATRLLVACLVAAVAVAGLLVPTATATTPTAAASTESAEWPRYLHGVDRNGVNPDESTISRTNVGTLTEQWSWSDENAAPSEPSVVDGVVYVAWTNGVVRAFDATTGSVSWSFTFDDNDPIQGSPAVADGMVFIGAGHGMFHALDATTGAPVWSVDVGEGPQSPAVVDGVIYVATRYAVVALDADTGDELWRTEAPDDATVVELALDTASDTVVASAYTDPRNDGSIFALSMDDGSLRWSTPIAAPWYAPSVSDGTAFVWSHDAVLYAVSVETGAIRWQQKTDNPTELGGWPSGTPVVAEGVVYAQGGAGVHAFDAATGTDLWLSNELGFQPTVTNGLLFNSPLRITDLTTHELVTSKDPIPPEIVATSPTIVDGMVFFGTRMGTGTLYAYAPEGPAPTAPDAPTSTYAGSGDQQAAVWWTRPVWDGGSPITGYKVTASPGGASCTAPPDHVACTVPNLARGVYTFTVTATNSVGTSPAAHISEMEIYSAPDAPTNVVATPKSGKVILEWLAPEDTGGTPITGFTVTASPGGQTCTTSTWYCDFNFLTNGTTYTFSVTATNGVGTGPAAISAPVTPHGYFPLPAPARLLDTRPGQSTIDGQSAGGGKVRNGSPLALKVMGRAGVPADASSVVLNVTVTEPNVAGNVTVYPCDQPVPLASNLNFTPGQTVPNAVVARLSYDGSVCFNSTSTTHLVVDVAGYFFDTQYYDLLTYTPLIAPVRMMDSRPGASTVDGVSSGFGPVAANTPQRLRLKYRAGVPSSAETVVLNVTVTEPATAGNVTVYPCDQPVPLASNVNFTPGRTVPNAVVARLTYEGDICLTSTSSTHLVVDLAGFFTGINVLVPRLAPARLLDSRPGQLTIDGQGAGIGKLRAGVPLQLQVDNRAGLPVHAHSVVLNVTVTEPSAAGNVTVYPCGQPVPLASNLNFVPGQTVANAVIAKVGTNGKVCFNSTAPTHLVVDVGGHLK